MKGAKPLLVATTIIIAILLALPQVVLASDQENEPVAKLVSVYDFNDPYFGEQWGLGQIQSLHIDNTCNEIVVAVLDTGIDVDHEDLAGKVIESINFTDSRTDKDIKGHGTHVAGIIAANVNNGIGIAGAAPNVKLLNVKVAEDSGIVWGSKVAKGIIWATDRGAKVINMSLTTPSNIKALEEAIKYAWEHGVVLVAASGNCGKITTYPAAYEEVITVAAMTPENELWPESNDGEFVDVCAPGTEIISTLPGNTYGYLSGSSMATAYVSAVVAQLLGQTACDNNEGNVNYQVVVSVEALFPEPTWAQAATHDDNNPNYELIASSGPLFKEPVESK